MIHLHPNLPAALLKCAAITAITAIAVASAAFATPAVAQSEPGLLQTQADTGPYVTAGLGRSSDHFDVGSATYNTPYEVGGNALGLQLAAGYRPLPAWSAEAGYLRLGRVSSGQSDATIDGLMLSALGYLPTPLLNLYGRLGVLDARTYGAYGSPPAPRPVLIHHHDSNLAFGIGLSTNFRGSLNFRLESQGFQVTHASSTSLLTLAFVWSFL